MFLLSLVCLYFCGNSLKCPLSVTNSCISLGHRQAVPHMPELIQILSLCWAGTKQSCWEAENCCQVSRSHLFKCLLNSPGPLAFFSNRFFLNFHSCFSFWKNSYQKFHDEFARLYAFLLTATFPQISVFRFSLWPLHHVCYADGISSCTDPAAGPGWAEAALILSILSITLPACWAAQTADYRILKVKDKTKHIFRDLKGWN